MAMDGRAEQAQAVLHADPPDPQSLVDHVFPFLNVMMCGVIAWHSADARLAARTLTALRPHRRCWVHHYVGSVGPVGLPLALCAAVLGDIEQAVALCEEAERVLVELGCNGLLPAVRAYYAQILLRRGSGDDRKRAANLLREARRGAEGIEAPDLVAAVERLRAEIDRAAR